MVPHLLNKKDLGNICSLPQEDLFSLSFRSTPENIEQTQTANSNSTNVQKRKLPHYSSKHSEHKY